MRTRVGIHGIGLHLPAAVRGNDWWPADVVRAWSKGGAAPAARGDFASEGHRLASRAIDALADDPFRGARERRVMADDVESSDMEVLAARDAIARAGCEPGEIDVLLTYAFCPDYLMTPNACRVHKQLGLPERCLTMGTEGACNSFQSQLALAEELLAGGRYRKALLVQSSSVSRVLPYDLPYSAWFGDGASAVVVGPVGEARGVVGRAHFTDGDNHEALVIGVPGKKWYQSGANRIYQAEPRETLQMVLGTVERGRRAVEAALAEAGLETGDVDFYACHQGFRWLREVTQAYLGLDRARWVDTFATFGHLGSGNLPTILAIGEREGMVKEGDVVALFSGGVGEVWSSTVLYWGRG